MVSPRLRSIAGLAGRILLGLVVAVVLGGAALILLAYYGDMKFGVQAVVIALVAAGAVVILWTRWR